MTLTDIRKHPVRAFQQQQQELFSYPAAEVRSCAKSPEQLSQPLQQGLLQPLGCPHWTAPVGQTCEGVPAQQARLCAAHDQQSKPAGSCCKPQQDPTSGLTSTSRYSSSFSWYTFCCTAASISCRAASRPGSLEMVSTCRGPHLLLRRSRATERQVAHMTGLWPWLDRHTRAAQRTRPPLPSTGQSWCPQMCAPLPVEHPQTCGSRPSTCPAGLHRAPQH